MGRSLGILCRPGRLPLGSRLEPQLKVQARRITGYGMMTERHIVARGGGGFSMEPRNPMLDDFVLRLARRRKRPRVCFVGTASGDSDTYIRRFHEAFPPSRAAATHLTFFERNIRDLKSFMMEQDVVYVGGGSSANMLAVWRLHGFDKVLRAAWSAG